MLEKSRALGLGTTATAELPPLDRVKLSAIVSEELAWGDSGLAGAITVDDFPVTYSMLAGNEAVVYCDGKLGCWGLPSPHLATRSS